MFFVTSFEAFHRFYPGFLSISSIPGSFRTVLSVEKPICLVNFLVIHDLMLTGIAPGVTEIAPGGHNENEAL